MATQPKLNPPSILTSISGIAGAFRPTSFAKRYLAIGTTGEGPMTMKRALLSIFGIAILFGTLNTAEAQYHHHHHHHHHHYNR